MNWEILLYAGLALVVVINIIAAVRIAPVVYKQNSSPPWDRFWIPFDFLWRIVVFNFALVCWPFAIFRNILEANDEREYRLYFDDSPSMMLTCLMLPWVIFFGIFTLICVYFFGDTHWLSWLMGFISTGLPLLTIFVVWLIELREYGNLLRGPRFLQNVYKGVD